MVLPATIRCCQSPPFKHSSRSVISISLQRSPVAHPLAKGYHFYTNSFVKLRMEGQISGSPAQATSTSVAQASTVGSMTNQFRLSSENHWAVVVQGLDKSYTLIQFRLQHTDCGENIWRDIRQQIRHNSLATSMTSWILMLLTRTVVGTGAVQMIWNPTRQWPVARVSLCDYHYDWQLTEAYYCPQTLKWDADHIVRNDRFSVKPTSTHCDISRQDVIVITSVLDKTRIAWLLIFLLIISPSLGLIVGLLSHNAATGIAVSAGVFALASFLQGLAVWFQG